MRKCGCGIPLGCLVVFSGDLTETAALLAVAMNDELGAKRLVFAVPETKHGGSYFLGDLMPLLNPAHSIPYLVPYLRAATKEGIPTRTEMILLFSCLGSDSSSDQ